MSIGRWTISTISRWAFGVAPLDGLRGVTSIFHLEFRIFHQARGRPSRSCARGSRAAPILALCTHRRAMRGAAAGHGRPHRGTGPGRPSRAPRPARRQGQRHNGSCSPPPPSLSSPRLASPRVVDLRSDVCAQDCRATTLRSGKRGSGNLILSSEPYFLAVPPTFNTLIGALTRRTAALPCSATAPLTW